MDGVWEWWYGVRVEGEVDGGEWEMFDFKGK